MLIGGSHLGIGIMVGVAVVAGTYYIGQKNGRTACVRAQVEHSYHLLVKSQKTAENEAESIRRRQDELEDRNAELDLQAQSDSLGGDSCFSARMLQRIDSIK